jgi:hypothetical protein
MGLLVVGVAGTGIGFALVANIGGLADLSARLSQALRYYPNHPKWWRLTGAITLGWAVPLSIWSAFGLR